MLYLRTGSNGTCKTLFTLKDVRDLQVSTGRPVAHNGRFKIKSSKEAEFGWKKIDFKDWWDEPDGTIFLIDEAYHDIPVRPNGQQPPQHIARLGEHRSRGFDLFLLCQHPSQIDGFVRKIVGAPGWHQHLKRVGGATSLTRVLQWDSVHDQCQKDGSGKTAQITNRLQPTEVYDWYDSAFIHTGKVRIPKQVFYFIGFLLLAIVMFWLAGHFLWKNVTKGAPVPTSAPQAMQTAYGGTSSNHGDKPKPLTAAEYAESYQPRIPALMHTAPAYDGLTQPRRVPVPAACIETKSKGCKCYTQDATPYPTEDAVCKQVVSGGIFLAFEERQVREPEQRQQKAQPVAQQVEQAPQPMPVRAANSSDGEMLAWMAKRPKN